MRTRLILAIVAIVAVTGLTANTFAGVFANFDKPSDIIIEEVGLTDCKFLS